ncbi:competence protein ComEC [Variovorax sp. OK212]|nr:protein of unknown function [Variovorax sp. OK202]SFE06496.1 competence protein ComEC [Variovorax sp. OK212]
MAFVCGALAGAGLAGWRATAYVQGALQPALEGRSVQVTGVVAEMPQHNESGARFRLDVESARWTDPAEQENGTDGAPPVVPDRIALGWYAEDLVTMAHAGERWRFTVRLKAPHGNRNPYGFDSELWMWEQGLHASGYVRTGARDAPPALLATTWLHPVERAREAVRDAVFQRVPDRNQAGVIAALVTGDQGAIDLLSNKGVVTPQISAFRGKTQASAGEAPKGVLFPRHKRIRVATKDVLFLTF